MRQPLPRALASASVERQRDGRGAGGLARVFLGARPQTPGHLSAIGRTFGRAKTPPGVSRAAFVSLCDDLSDSGAGVVHRVRIAERVVRVGACQLAVVLAIYVRHVSGVEFRSECQREELICDHLQLVIISHGQITSRDSDADWSQSGRWRQ